MVCRIGNINHTSAHRYMHCLPSFFIMDCLGAFHSYWCYFYREIMVWVSTAML